MGIVDNALIGASGQSGYNLTRSLRFRSSASAYLNRNPASATNRTTYTLSAWIKRGSLGVGDCALFGAQTDANNRLFFRFEANDTLNLYFNVAGTAYDSATSMVFRDPSAWYHIVIAIDTTQATASNRIKVYVNGTQQTLGTYSAPPQNTNTQWNNTVAQYIGKKDNASNFFDGYMAEVYSIDGQALTPSSFGSTNALTGVWQPARYTGTYGTNGFYLPFTDNSGATATTIGKDFSGNGNNWTPNNISVTAGVTYDSMTDVPTLTSATAANFAVLNPLDNGGLTITNGNLNASRGGGGSWVTAKSTIGVASGKWYWEFTSTVNQSAGGPNQAIGISKASSPLNTYLGSDANSWSYFQDNGNKWTNNTGSAYGADWDSGDVIGVALDVDNGTLTFYKNNVSQGTAFTGLTSGLYFPSVAMENGSAGVINFGQRPFTYTPPTGFVALNTYNLPTSTIVKGNTVMDATLYTGTGASLSVTNAASFKPDLVWVKSRSAATDHAWYDSVRGTTKQLESNNTGAETTEATGLTTFGSAGFTIGALAQMNTSAATYVGWQWQAGQGTSSSNTNGSITSTVSVNASAGFSVVTYTGTGANATVGHGLGVAPSLIIAKSRGAATNWGVWHTSLTASSYFLLLNTTAAQATAANSLQALPTSTLVSLGASSIFNDASTMVMYCWTPIAGYSAFGSYTGNGSTDGPFVYTGFRPKWVMVKATSTTENWAITDSARSSFNAANALLRADESSAETTGAMTMDFNSNGFKMRTTDSKSNGSGVTYIYIAFAENPFKNALAR
jgi:hypothetical protein